MGNIEYLERLEAFFTKCAELRSYITKFAMTLESETIKDNETKKNIKPDL